MREQVQCAWRQRSGRKRLTELKRRVAIFEKGVAFDERNAAGKARRDKLMRRGKPVGSFLIAALSHNSCSTL